jgi:hypothetical protein
MLGVTDFATLLHATTGLVHFTSNLDEEGPDLLSPVPALMHLESLTLGDNEPDYYGCDDQKILLDGLTTPALQHLTVSERMFEDDALPTILRSQCTLTSLHVTHAMSSEDAYRNAFPTIQNLTVTASSYH